MLEMIFILFLASAFAVSFSNVEKETSSLLHLENLEKVWNATSGAPDFQKTEIIALIVANFPKEEFLRPVYLRMIEMAGFLPKAFKQSYKKALSVFFP